MDVSNSATFVFEASLLVIKFEMKARESLKFTPESFWTETSSEEVERGCAAMEGKRLARAKKNIMNFILIDF